MEMGMIFQIVAGLVIALGLVGTLLPMIPGLLFVFLGLLLWAWSGDFQTISWATIQVLMLLTVMGFVLDFAAGAWGAKRGGANKEAVWGAVLGSVLGLMFLGPLGLILGPLIGATMGQLLYGDRKDVSGASRVGVATLFGVLLGSVAKLVIGFLMIVAAWLGWTF